MTTESTSGNEQSSFFSSSTGADTWRQGAARRAQVLGPATERMLDLAGVGPGCRVLDVAAGTGEQSLLAAHRVGPGGAVLVTDISASMLQVAIESAGQAGLTNIETQVMGAQELDVPPESFDAVISRLGLMFIPDLPQALLGIYKALRPGSKFAAIVWGPSEHNPVSVACAAIARRYDQIPAGVITEEQLYALGEGGALGEALQRAGFRDVAIEPMAAIRRFESTQEAAGELFQTNPFLSQARTQLAAAEKVRFLEELELALQPFAGPDGFEGPAEVLVGVGTK